MFTLTWLRSFRLLGFSFFDTALSFIGVLILGPLLSKLFRYLHLDIPQLSWFYLVVPLGILVHVLIKLYTPLTLQFLDPQGHYLVKIIILGLVFLGIMDIRVIKTK